MKRFLLATAVILALTAVGYFAYIYYADQTTYKTSFDETVTLKSASTPVGSFSELVNTSSIIVQGTATDTGTYRIKTPSNNALENKEGIYTDYPIKGKDLRSTDVDESVFVLALDGGVKNKKKYAVLDAPIIAKNQEYIIFAVTNSDGLLRPLANGNAVATKIDNTTYKLPDNVGIPEDDRVFTLDSLKKTIKK